MSELIFITGATGFIGSRTTLDTLKAGFRVRLSVRRPEQITKLKKVFAEYSSQLDIVIVSDITHEEEFVPVLSGVDHVFHLASPLAGKGEDLQTHYIRPAVDGTMAIVRAATQVKTIKTVVVTSSFAALCPLGGMRGKQGVVLHDNTHTKYDIDLDMEIPPGPPGYATKYQISKILAHQTMVEFVSSNTLHFKTVTLHPSFVFGPNILQTTTEEIDGTNKQLLAVLTQKEPKLNNGWVHVRNIAEAFLKVVANPNIPNGLEILLSAPPVDAEEIFDYMQKNYPDFKPQPPAFFGTVLSDTSTSDKYLGIHFAKGDEIVKDLLDSQRALGFGK